MAKRNYSEFHIVYSPQDKESINQGKELLREYLDREYNQWILSDEVGENMNEHCDIVGWREEEKGAGRGSGKSQQEVGEMEGCFVGKRSFIGGSQRGNEVSNFGATCGNTKREVCQASREVLQRAVGLTVRGNNE